MKDTEAQQLVVKIKEMFPHVHVIIANQPGRSALWSIVKVHSSLDQSDHFTLTSTQEWERLKAILRILSSPEDRFSGLANADYYRQKDRLEHL